jgi:hypothetical protein
LVRPEAQLPSRFLDRAVVITDQKNNPLVPGSEMDWLAFYWDVTTNPAASSPINVTTLLSAYNAALNDPTTGTVTAEVLIAHAPTDVRSFMTGRAVAHSVQSP